MARGSEDAPAGARLVRTDRTQDQALSSIQDLDRGGEWAPVIDLTRRPEHACRAVRDLRARHWVLVSSGNVYASFSRRDQPESAELVTPPSGDVMEDVSQYGQAKVACENSFRGVRRADGAPASWSIIRSGLIGGSGDWSGRSSYYPWRFALPTSDVVLVPPDLTFPTAMIDTEDLAAFILDCAEHRHQGVFNATGPTQALGEVLSTAAIRPVKAALLRALGVSAWMGSASLPGWPDDPEWRWFTTMDTTAARRAGLRTRPLEDTPVAALDHEHHRGQPRATGLTDDEENQLRSRLT